MFSQNLESKEEDADDFEEYAAAAGMAASQKKEGLEDVEFGGQRVLVAARLRPLLQGEHALHENRHRAVIADRQKNSVTTWLPPSSRLSATPEKAKRKIFEFDFVFDPESSQTQVFESLGQPLVESVLKGINGCLIAYGQTGAGKTFTTFGPDGKQKKAAASEPTKFVGLIPRIVHSLFTKLNDRVENARTALKKTKGRDYSPEFSYALYVTYYQLYLDSHIQDLLCPGKNELQIRIGDDSNGIGGHHVDGLSVHRVTCLKEIMDLLTLGNRNKVVTQTSMNATSSRSHCVFTLQLVQHTGSRTVKDSSSMLLRHSVHTLRGKLTCVDLAGSERVNRTHPNGLQLEEAKSINRSLSALGNVIAALGNRESKNLDTQSFIPWRDSKLTKVLKDSLAGNSRVSLIINVGPGAENVKESINSLLFGRRTMSVSVAPQVNSELDRKELPTDFELSVESIKQNYRNQIANLQRKIEEKDSLIARLQQEESSDEQESEMLEEALIEHIEQNQKLEEEIKALKENSTINAEIIELRTSNVHLREKLHLEERRADAETQRAEEAQLAVESAQVLSRQLKQQMESHEEVFRKQQEGVEELETQIQSMKLEIKEKDEEICVKASEKDMMGMILRDAQEEVRALREQGKKSQETNMKQLREELEVVEQRLEEMMSLRERERELFEKIIHAQESHRPLTPESPLLASPRLKSALHRSKMALARAMEAINHVE